MPLSHTIIHQLQTIVGAQQVLAAPALALTYERDAGLIAGRPDAVVLPTRIEQVGPFVRCLAAAGAPIVPWGAGTGLTGGAVAGQGGVVISCAALRRITALDPDARQVMVEPGVVNEQLDRAAAEHGLAYPPDPASGRTSTLGGNIAENAGGPRCLKYGVTANYVLGLETVLADGSDCAFGGSAFDRPEPNFLDLLIGSEGTLALITRARLRLVPRPQAACTLLAAFQTPEQAGTVVSEVVRSGLRPASLELLDGIMYGLVKRYTQMDLPSGAGALLVGDVEGYAEALADKVRQLEAIARRHEPLLVRVATDTAEREAIWYARKSASAAITLVAPTDYAMDVALPRSRLPEAFREISRLGTAAGFTVGYLAHAGDGNIHPEIFCDLAKTGELERVHALSDRIIEFVVSMGGSISGEHGIGLEKQRHLPLMYGPDELAAMRDVKEVFDPQGVLNPGKIFLNDDLTPLPPLLPGGGEKAAPLPSQGRGWGLGGAAAQAGCLRYAPDEFCPTSVAELQASLRDLQTAGRPVWLAGGQTKCATCDLPVLSTRRLTGIIAKAYDDLYVTVAAGTRLADVQAELARDGYILPLAAVWPGATVGGTVAANFNAPWRGVYGGVRDLLLCADVALPDGRLLHLGRPLVKDVAGYALAKLFVGSFGVFGVMTTLSLRVYPQPAASLTFHLPCPDLATALAAGRALGKPAEYVSALLLLQGFEDGLLPPRVPYHLVATIEGAMEDVRLAGTECRRLMAAAGRPPPETLDGVTGSALWAQMLGGTGCITRIGVPPAALPKLLAESPMPGAFAADLAHGLLYICHAPGASQAPAESRDSGSTSAQRLGGYAVALGRDVFPPRPFQMAPRLAQFARELKRRWDPAEMLNRHLMS